jgi:DEAD/DEAH box helicase domain-containing protein
MKALTFDIESQNTFRQVGSQNAADLDLALVSVHDSDTDKITTYLQEDLPKLWPTVESCDMLIGYNSNHFDIPLLDKYYPGDLTLIKSLDLLVEIKDACGRRLKLDGIAAGTVGEHKSAHGLQAIVWWQQGEIEKIKQYCEDDVRLTRKIYDIARDTGKLVYEYNNERFDIEIDASDWEEKESTSMTHTLPF